MTKANSDKKALLSSVFALLICVAMLIGTTFAWFTDTASTAVNRIEAGTLKVDIVKDDGETSLKGESMSFVNAEGSDDILWEPGVNFKTTAFKIKSTGTLALKYKLALNGVTGDNMLLKVIKFSVIDDNGTELDLDTFEGHLTPSENLSGNLYIQGHMDEAAGNEYQGKELTALGITVVAAQDTYEKDSTSDQYDKDAAYPVADKQDLIKAIEEINNAETHKTSTIVVTEDFTFDDETLAFKKGNVTLDLSDNKLSITSDGKDGISLENGAELTITGGDGELIIDNGSGKGIRLKNTAEADKSTKLTLKDIKLDIQNNASVQSAIYAYAENGDKNIEINLEKGAEINITGNKNFSAVQLANNAVLNFNGGVINASGTGSVLVAGRNDAGKDADDIVLNFNDGLINITGGEVIGIECNYFATANMNGGTIRISGENSGSYAVGASFGGLINLNGGKIEVNASKGKAYAVATYGNYSNERKSTVNIEKNFEITFGNVTYNELADLYPYTVLNDKR